MNRDMKRFLAVCAVVVTVCTLIIYGIGSLGREGAPRRTYDDVIAERGPDRPPPAIDNEFLSGRWCDLSGNSLEFLPSSSTVRTDSLAGAEISHRYALAGPTVNVAGPANERGSWTLAPIDFNDMSVERDGRAPERFRRC